MRMRMKKKMMMMTTMSKIRLMMRMMKMNMKMKMVMMMMMMMMVMTLRWRSGWGCSKDYIVSAAIYNYDLCRIPICIDLDCSAKPSRLATWTAWTFDTYIIEGSLEVKLPTIWRDEKQSREEAERRERLEERREEEKDSEERRCRCAKR